MSDIKIAPALYYARRGWPVIPLRPGSKIPASAHGVLDATTDEETIARWPGGGNTGLACGVAFWVLDVDPRNGGDEALPALMGGRELPRTLTARTAGGGVHFYFAPVPFKTRARIGPGLDVQGRGKYVVAPPSVVDGRKYFFETKAPLASAPTWLLDVIRAPESLPPPPPLPVPAGAGDVVARARAYLSRVGPAISGSGGHAHTFVVAQKLCRGFALDEGTSVALLSEWNLANKPPWSAADLARKVKEAMRAGTMQIGALLDRGR